MNMQTNVVPGSVQVTQVPSTGGQSVRNVASSDIRMTNVNSQGNSVGNPIAINGSMNANGGASSMMNTMVVQGNGQNSQIGQVNQNVQSLQGGMPPFTVIQGTPTGSNSISTSNMQTQTIRTSGDTRNIVQMPSASSVTDNRSRVIQLDGIRAGLGSSTRSKSIGF